MASSTISSLNLTIDMSFDLDEALTMPQRPDHPRPPPPSASDIDSLATVEAAAAQACPVCMKCFGPGRAGKRVPCGHVYHQACITEWSLRHNSCPLCRSKIFHDN